MARDLGALLTLIHDAPCGMCTMTATVRTWTDRSVSQAAFMAEVGGRDDTMVSLGDELDDGPAEREQVTRFWLEPPDRARQESDDGLAIRNGVTWWQEMDGRLVTNAGGDENFSGGAAVQFDLWLEPHFLLSMVRLEPIGEDDVAGRAAHRVRATPRSGREIHFQLHRLGAAGADEYELAIDAKLGILLAVEARFRGDVFHRAAVESIEVDAALDPALFEPPPGVPAISVSQAFATPRHNVAVHEAATLAEFPVFVAAGLPDDWRIGHGIWVQDPPTFHLQYRDHTDALGFTLTQCRDDPDDARAWERGPVPYDEVSVGDETALVRDREVNNVQTQIRLVRDGTAIEVVSDSLSADTLWPLLAGLVPAPTTAPDFG